MATSPRMLTLNSSIDFHARELVVISPRCHDEERNGKKVRQPSWPSLGLNANQLEHRSWAGEVGNAARSKAAPRWHRFSLGNLLAKRVTSQNDSVRTRYFRRGRLKPIVSALPALLVKSFAAKSHCTFKQAKRVIKGSHGLHSHALTQPSAIRAGLKISPSIADDYKRLRAELLDLPP